MRRFYVSIGVFVLVIVLFVACESDKPVQSSSIDLDSLPYGDESQDMALYYSGEYYPPEKLTRDISRDLYRIRTRWDDTLTDMWGAFFETPWFNSTLELLFDSTTSEEILNGVDSEWNNFITQYNFTVTTYLPFFRRAFNLHPPEKVHPERLAEQIEALHLRGITWLAVPQRPWPRGGNIARVEEGVSTKYYFYSSSCPDIYFSYAYFEITPQKIIYHGTFHECPGNTSGWWNGLSQAQIEAVFDSLEASRPAWVDTARIAIRELENGLHYQWNNNK